MSENLSNKMKGMKKIVLGIFCLVAALFVCAAFDDVKSVSADNIYYYQSSGMHPDGNQGLVLVPKAGTTYASADTKPAEIEDYEPSSVDFDGYFTSKFTKAFNTTTVNVVISVPSSYEFENAQVNWVVNETFYQINAVKCTQTDPSKCTMNSTATSAFYSGTDGSSATVKFDSTFLEPTGLTSGSSGNTWNVMTKQTIATTASLPSGSTAGYYFIEVRFFLLGSNQMFYHQDLFEYLPSASSPVTTRLKLDYLGISAVAGSAAKLTILPYGSNKTFTEQYAVADQPYGQAFDKITVTGTTGTAFTTNLTSTLSTTEATYIYSSSTNIAVGTVIKFNVVDRAGNTGEISFTYQAFGSGSSQYRNNWSTSAQTYTFNTSGTYGSGSSTSFVGTGTAGPTIALNSGLSTSSFSKSSFVWKVDGTTVSGTSGTSHQFAATTAAFATPGKHTLTMTMTYGQSNATLTKTVYVYVIGSIALNTCTFGSVTSYAENASGDSMYVNTYSGSAFSFSCTFKDSKTGTAVAGTSKTYTRAGNYFAASDAGDGTPINASATGYAKYASGASAAADSTSTWTDAGYGKFNVSVVQAWYVTNNFDRYVMVKKATLAAPTGLTWSTSSRGTATWTDSASITGITTTYSVSLYKGSTSVSTVSVAAGTKKYDFASTIRTNGAGTYTFKVTAVSGDTTKCKNSGVATSNSAYARSVSVTSGAGLSGTYINANGTTSYIVINGQSVDISTTLASGYSFDGWSSSNTEVTITSATTLSTKITFTASATGTSAVTITAAATARTYSVSFDSNGGSAVSSKNVTFAGTYGTLSSPTRTGYQFDGWYKNEADNVSKTMTATSAYTYTVLDSYMTPGRTYHLYIDSVSISAGSATQFAVLIYDFTQSKSLASYKHSFGSNFSYSYTVPSSAVSGNKISLIIYAGINGSTTGNTVTFTNAFVMSEASTAITSTTTVNTAADHTLFAHWIANTATITIRKDSTAWSSSGMNVALYSGTTPTYAYASGAVSGSTVKWSVVTAGTYNVYAGKNDGAKTTLVDTGIDVTVSSSTGVGTATINYYTLTVSKGTGISSVSGGAIFLSGQSASIDATVSTGYTWSKWKNGSNEVSTTKATTYTVSSTVTLTATATINSYTVTYNATTNGGTFGSASSSYTSTATVNYNAAIDLSTTNRLGSKTGWTFVGWNTSSTAQEALTSLKMGTANVILYAIYKVTYTGSFYQLDTATAETVPVTIYNTATKGTITSPAVTSKSGHTIVGWGAGTSATSASVASGATVSISSNISYYAIYSYSITASYDANGGSGTVSSHSGTGYLTAKGGTSHTTTGWKFTLKTNAFTYIGRTFSKWAEGSTSGTEYSAGTSRTITSSKTYYAKWTANTYTVSFDSNGGSAVSSKTVTYASTYGTLTNPTRTGYTFKGWQIKYHGSENYIANFDGFTAASSGKWVTTNSSSIYATLGTGITYDSASKSYVFPGTAYAQITGLTTQSIVTLEVVSKSASGQTSNSIIFLTTNGVALGWYGANQFIGSSVTTTAVSNAVSDYSTSRYKLTNFAITYNNATVSYFNNGSAIGNSSATNNWSNDSGNFIGGRAINGGTYFQGNIYAIRLTSGILTADQLAANSALDALRFSSGISGLGTITSSSNVQLPGNHTLVAVWEANALNFSASTITKTFSTSAQTGTITAASNGTGSYTYSITSGNDSSYFSISGTTVTIKASTPATSYSITVKVVDNNSSVTATATITIKINKANLSGSVTITGTNTYNQTLTASVTNTNSATLTYQWYSNGSNSTSGGTAISGATSGTYKIGDGLVGKYIYVVVSASKTNYNSTTWSDITDAAISAATISVSKSNYSAVYDGAAHSGTVTATTINSQSATIYYKAGTKLTSSNYSTTGSTTNPTYTNVTSAVTVYYYIVANNHSDASGNFTVTITAKAVTVTAAAQTISYGSSISTAVSKATLSGQVSGHTLATVTLTPSTTEVTTSGTITPSAATIKSGSTDVTSNYSITYVAGTLTITAINATLTLGASSVSGLIYNGTKTNTVKSNVAGSYTVASGDTAYVTITSPTSATNLAVNTNSTITLKGVKYTTSSITITITFTPTSSNYKTTTKTFTVAGVAKASFTPTVSMSGYTYKGTVSTPSISGNTSGGTVTYYYTTSNTNSGGTKWENITNTTLNAGTYYIYATVAATTNYNAATSAAKSFTIAKATGYVTLSATSGSVTYGTASKTFTVSTNHGGTLTPSETHETATVSISGTTVTVATLATISPTTIEVTVTCAATTNYNAATAKYTLTITSNTITINVYKDGSAWSSSGMNIALYSGTTSKFAYSAATVSGSTVKWSTVPSGTYNIYAGQHSSAKTTLIDTGVDIVVSANSPSQTIDYYTVTISAGTGGSVNLTSLIVLKNQTYSASSATLTVSNQTSTATPSNGYSFSKWALNSTSGTTVGTSATAITTATKIYAVFSANTYTVTYDENGGAAISDSTYKVTSGTLTLTTTTRTGYTFAGWKVTAITGTAYSNSGVTIAKDAIITQVYTGSYANITVQAQWTANTATITIKKDGATWSSSGMNIALYSGGTEKYAYSAATASGATVKWSVVTAGTYDVYAGKNGDDKTSLKDTGLTVTVSSTGTATVDYYTISFTVNEATYGKVSQASIVVLKNETYGVGSSNDKLTVSSKTITATITNANGYTTTFTKWAKDSASGTALTTSTTAVTTATSIYVVFARSINTYTVTYDYNGGYANLAPNPDFSAVKTQTDVGWNNDLNGTIVPSTGWGPGYNSGVPCNTKGYHAHIYNFNSNYVLRFKTNEAYDGITCTTETDKTAGTITTTRWLGMSSSSLGTSLVAGHTYRLVMDLYSVSDVGAYVTSGIYYRKTSSDSSKSFHSGTPAFKPTASGVWQTISNEFTMNSQYNNDGVIYVYGHNGGRGEIYVDNIRLYDVTTSTSSTKSYKVTDETFALMNVAKAGYTFAGWKVTAISGTAYKESGSAIANGNTITQIYKGSYANITVQAQWTATKYAVKFDLNNGGDQNTYISNTNSYTGTNKDTGYIINWDKNFAISTQFSISATGQRYLIFGNYNKGKHINVEINADNIIRLYINDATVDRTLTGGTVAINTTYTLKFSWTASTNTYNISIAGTGYNNSMTGTCDISGISETTLLMGTDRRSSSGSTFKTKINISDLTISTGGASSIIAPNYMVSYQGTYGTLPTPVRIGYTFNGWYTAASGGTQITSTTKFEGLTPCTVYAHWTANELVFDGGTLAAGTYGDSYTSSAFSVATNGTGDYTYSIVSGAPSGISLTSSTRVFSGTIKGNAGTYSIVVRAKDNKSGVTKDATFTLVVNKRQLTISWPSQTEYTYNGSAYTINATLGNKYGSDTVNVSTYSGNTGTNVGSFTAKVTAVSNSNYSIPTNSFAWKIVAKNITGATVTLGAALTYTSEEQTKTVTSVVIDGLTATVNVSGNNQTNAGNYTMTITGTGNFSGSISQAWDIAKRNMSAVNVAAVADQTYTGSAITPTPAVTYGKDTLTTSSHFTFSYSNNTNVGTATITLTAKSTATNYTGTKSVQFKIVAQSLSGTVTVSGTTTYGQTLSVSYTGGNSATATYNIQWQYLNSSTWTNISGATGSTLKLTSSTLGITMVAGKQVRFILTGKTNFGSSLTSSASTAIATKNVAAGNISITPSATVTKVYDKTTAVAQSFTLAFKSGVIESGDTVTLASVAANAATYDNVNVGTGKTVTMTVSSSGTHVSNYTIVSSVTTTGAITAKTLTFTWSSTKEFTYDGSEKSVTVTYTGNISGDTITLTYSNNKKTNVGNYTASVTSVGNSNYAIPSNSTCAWNIKQASASITLTAVTSLTYTGSVQNLVTYNVVTVGATKLTTSFSTKYNSGTATTSSTVPTGINAGTYTVTITVTGDANTAGGTKTVEVTIAKRNLSAVSIASVSNKTYTGSAIRPTPAVTYNDMTLTSGTHFDYSYSNNTNVGTATITITAVDSATNYTGSKSINFTIVKAASTNPTLTPYNGTYDATAHKISVSGGAGGTIKYSTDQSTWSTTNPTYTDVGEYTVYVKVFGDSNHSDSSIISSTVKITKKAITVSVTATNRAYNGSKNVTISCTYTGTVASQTLAVTCGSATVSNANVGTNKTVTYTLNVADGTSGTIGKASNYSWSKPTVTVNITAVTLTDTTTGYTGTYDATAHTITVSASGFVNSETLASVGTIKYGTESGTYNLTTAPTRTNAGKTTVYYQITFTNYATITGSKVITINQKAITLTVTATNKVYDGNTDISISVCTYTGTINNETLTMTCTNAKTADANVANGKTVTYTLSITNGTVSPVGIATNYSWTQPTVTVNITKANAVNPSISGYTGTYDATAHSISVSGGTGGTVQYSTDNSNWSTTKPTYTNAGTYVTYVRMLGDANHNNSSSINASVVINKKALTLTVTATNRIYDGTKNVAISTCSYTGTVGTETLSMSCTSTTPTVADKNVANNKEVSYSLTMGNGTGLIANYSYTKPTVKVNITQRTVTVTWTSTVSFKYDGAAHSVTATLGNIIDGDTVTPTYANNSKTDVGNYTASITALSDSNYKLPTSGTTCAWSITQAKATVTLTAVTGLTYTGSELTLVTYTTKTVGATKLTTSFSTKYNSGTASVTSTAPKGTNAGSYEVTITVTGDANTAGDTKTVTVTIAKRSLADVTIAAVSAKTYTGSAIRPTPAVTYNNMTLTSGTHFTYAYSNNTNVGTATITINAVESAVNYTGSQSIQFKIDNQVLAGTVTVSGTATYGEVVSVKYTTTNSGTPTYSIKWQIGSDSSWTDLSLTTASIELNSKTLNVTTIAGKQVRYILTGTGNYSGTLTATATATIAKKSITADSITATASATVTREYDGTKNVYQSFTLAFVSGVVESGDTLTLANIAANKATYSDVNVGTGKTVTMTITVSGTHAANYSVATSKTTTGDITARAISNATFSTLSDIVYTGSAITQSFTLTDKTLAAGSKTLKSGTDYTVSYSNNVNVGTATITVTGKGNYKSTHSATFKILEAQIVYTSSSYSAEYDGKSHGITLNVTSPSGTTITYGTSAGSYTLTSNPTYKNVATVTVYFKIVKANYTTVEDSETITITRRDISNATVSTISDKIYTGSAITQSFTLTDENIAAGSTLLTNNTDYTVSYSNNVNVGTATITITGKGNYTGIVTKTFKIAKAAASLTVKNYEGTYDGNGHTLTVTSSGGTVYYKLSGGTYSTDIATVTYINAGTYTVYVKLTGDANHSDIAEKAYTVKINTFAVTVTAKSGSIYYTNTATQTFNYDLNKTLPKSETLSGALSVDDVTSFNARKIGSYEITQGTLTNANNTNYTITYVKNTFTILDNVAPTFTSNKAVTNGNTIVKDVDYTTQSSVTFTIGASDAATSRSGSYALKLYVSIDNGSTYQLVKTANAKSTTYTYEFKVNEHDNGQYKIKFKLEDASGNVKSLGTYIISLLSIDWAEGDFSTQKVQHTVTFVIPSYVDLTGVNDFSALSYFFSTNLDTLPEDVDFVNHGVSHVNINTEFKVDANGDATVKATTPLGLNGEYKMFVRVNTLNGAIIYAQPSILNIAPSEENKASVLNFDTLSASIGGNGQNGVVSLSASGTTVIAENNGEISTMATVSFNDSSIYMLESDGSKVWEITLSYNNELTFVAIEERSKDIVLIAVGNSTMIDSKRLSINSLNTYLYIIRLSLLGDLIDVETASIESAEYIVSAMDENNIVVVVENEVNNYKVIMFDGFGDVLWTRNIESAGVVINSVDVNNGFVAVAAENSAKNITIDGTSLTLGNRGELDAVLLGFNVEGELVFYSTIGGAMKDSYSKVAIHEDRIYVLGTTFNTMIYVKDGSSMINANRSNQDAMLVVYGMNGKIVNYTFIAGEDDEELTSITFDDDQLIVAGTTNSEKIEPSSKSGKAIKITGKSEDAYVAYVLHIQKSNLVINSASEVDGSTQSIESIVVNETSNDITYLGVTANASVVFTQHTLVAEDIDLTRNGNTVNITSNYRYKDVEVYLNEELVESTTEGFKVKKTGEYKVVITDYQGATIVKTITIDSLGGTTGSVSVGLIAAFAAAIAIIFVVVFRVYKSRKRMCA